MPGGLQRDGGVLERAHAPVDRVALELLRQRHRLGVDLGVALAAAALTGLALLAFASALSLLTSIAFSNCATEPRMFFFMEKGPRYGG
jgi:hypothetical protein